MSKKKAVTTMTLKDFHGGSIPSELPLPSAPAAAVARPRVPVASPTAAAAAAAMPSFLTNPSRIGRHFDEDERTPFEPAAPRRPAPSPTSYAPAPVVAPTRSGSGNAWGPRKEASPASSPVGPAPASAGGQIWSATRIAQASAVEKVISGRWHTSKPSSPPAPVTVPAPVLITVAPPEVERPRSVGVRELDSGVERGAAPVRPASHEGRVGGEGRDGDTPERPRLKLLPRSKPIEAPEPSPTYVAEKQVHQVQVTANLMKAEVDHDVHQNAMTAKTGVLGADAESKVAERPRLNLKPRSYATGQSDEMAVKERPSLFGGARPREQVLKERGVDVLASDLERISPVGRSKGEFAKVEQKVEALSINPSLERADGFSAGHRGPRSVDKKDYRRDTEKADAYRPSRREDNRRVARDMEKPQEQPRPEPETWRKPVEPPKPEVATPRFGKAATALELAQAFSTSMSDTAPQNRLTSVPSPRVPLSPGARDQSGFSRLTDSRTLRSSPSQRKINGY
ncbi:eukaryotic translation initiation factor-related [Zea mays]|uniref:Eukaryotic translation initiation factor-related n=1 Tax=Zea mays TaxID=4577 RepID=A0A1D6IE72_MAIZE|nr:eukaryotic translation initiation factor-related [Zea mays]